MLQQTEKNRSTFSNSQVSHQNMRLAPRNFPFKAGNRNDSFPRRLMRQIASKKVSDTERVAYLMEIFEHSLRGDTQIANEPDYSRNNSSKKSPWITIRNQFNRNEEVVIPLSLCSCLLECILSCADTSEDNVPVPCEIDTHSHSKSVSTEEVHEVQTDAVMTNKNAFEYVEKSLFDVTKLENIEFKSHILNYQLRITSECPPYLESEEKLVDTQIDKFRWIACGPLPSMENSVPGSKEVENDNSPNITPWNKLGYIQLYEQLLPDLAVFLTDVNVRYRDIDLNPEVKPIFSVSGERQFFFDLRNTRWGHRLHISQVTDLHRNVIGIPMETLVTFRDRLDILIKILNLEEGTNVRRALEKHSTPQRYWKPNQRYRQNFSGQNQFRQRQNMGDDRMIERPIYPRQNPAQRNQTWTNEESQVMKSTQEKQMPNFTQENRKPNLVISNSISSSQANKKVQPNKHIKFAEQTLTNKTTLKNEKNYIYEEEEPSDGVKPNIDGHSEHETSLRENKRENQVKRRPHYGADRNSLPNIEEQVIHNQNLANRHIKLVDQPLSKTKLARNSTGNINKEEKGQSDEVGANREKQPMNRISMLKGENANESNKKSTHGTDRNSLSKIEEKESHDQHKQVEDEKEAGYEQKSATAKSKNNRKKQRINIKNENEVTSSESPTSGNYDIHTPDV